MYRKGRNLQPYCFPISRVQHSECKANHAHSGDIVSFILVVQTEVPGSISATQQTLRYNARVYIGYFLHSDWLPQITELRNRMSLHKRYCLSIVRAGFLGLGANGWWSTISPCWLEGHDLGSFCARA